MATCKNQAFDWGVVVNPKDGLAYVNDFNNGLWIIRVNPKRPAAGDAAGRAVASMTALRAGALAALLLTAGARARARSAQAAPAPVPPAHDYLVFVASEGNDQVALVRFGPKGAHVERTHQVGPIAPSSWAARASRCRPTDGGTT